MIKVQCPHCKEVLDIPERHAGQTGKCIHCGGTVYAPTESATTTPPPVNQPHVSEERTGSSDSLVRCPDCNREISRRAEQCPHCGAPQKKSQSKPANILVGCVVFVVLFFAFVGFVGSNLPDSNKESSSNYQSNQAQTSTTAVAKPQSWSNKTSAEPSSSNTGPKTEKWSDIPAETLARIRQDIENRYPDNFSMQKVLIEAQVDAYRDLENYNNPGIPDDVISRMYNDISSRYPYNFSMQKTLLDAQVDDYLSMHGQSSQSQRSGNLNAGNRQAQSHAAESIREKAEREWPSDYQMQQYVIKNQTEAQNRLSRGNVYGIPDRVYNQLRENAAREWPNDFEMQEHVIKNQADAYRAIERGNTYGVPQSVYENVLRQARRDWPNDYEMQKHTLESQLEAYRGSSR